MINSKNMGDFELNLGYLSQIAGIISNSPVFDLSDKSEAYETLGTVLSNIQKAIQSVKDTLGWFNKDMISGSDVENFKIIVLDISFVSNQYLKSLLMDFI